jgi:hypothetical protein
MKEEQSNKIKLFENQRIRAVWDEQDEKWWFSVLDVIGILTDQPDYQKVRNYWKWLKNKLIAEGSELFDNTNQLDEKGEPVSNTNQLKMLATIMTLLSLAEKRKENLFFRETNYPLLLLNYSIIPLKKL